VLLVLDETVNELNSSTDGVAANAPDAAYDVRKAGAAVRLRHRLLADCAAVGSGCTPAACTRCPVVVTAGGSVLLQICEHGSQIIKERIAPRDLLRVTRRRHEIRIRRLCSSAQDHDH